MADVGALTLSAKAARVEAEGRFGEALRALVAKSGVAVVDAARALGIRREDLYEVFDSQKHMRAAWLALLPPAVEKIYLDERAAFHGYELTPVAKTEASFAEAAPLILSTLSQCAASEADGELNVEECIADLAKLDALEVVIAGMKAKRRRAVTSRGLSLVTVAK